VSDAEIAPPLSDGVWQRFTSSVCRRAFSSPEALGYEVLISPAVLRVVAPQIAPQVVARQVLDVGCGAGELGRYLRKDRGAEVVGVDPSTAQSRRAGRSGGVAVRATAGGLPFRAASFDTVVSSCAIKHWPDPIEGLGECARVLRPGGRLVLVEIDGEGSIAEVRRFARTTRVPPGLRDAYVRFAMRTVVGVAPSGHQLHQWLATVFPTVELTKVDGWPFLRAVAAP
jgi:ubiquinone/menaquinone biosynthesis C-methylase UbiE